MTDRAAIDRLAPITWSIGFLELPLEEAIGHLVDWRHELAEVFTTRHVRGNFEAVLKHLLPLTAPRVRRTLVQTRGNRWTAYFDNGTGGPDAVSPLGYLARRTERRAVVAIHVRQTIRRDRMTGMWGGAQFHLMGPGGSRPLGYIRVIDATNDGGRWDWGTSGKVQPFEHPERYTARLVRDRLTRDTIEEYCQALGIDVYDPSFYGPEAMLMETHGEYDQMTEWTLEQARRQYLLEPET